MSDPDFEVLEEDETSGYLHAVVRPGEGSSEEEDLEIQVLPGTCPLLASLPPPHRLLLRT